MIFSLILGAILGGVSVVFILQNTALITVSFLSWQFEGSLALILLLTIICGVLITLLFLMPSLIKETFYVSRIRKQHRTLEDELAATKRQLSEASSQPLIPQSDPIE